MNTLNRKLRLFSGRVKVPEKNRKLPFLYPFPPYALETSDQRKASTNSPAQPCIYPTSQVQPIGSRPKRRVVQLDHRAHGSHPVDEELSWPMEEIDILGVGCRRRNDFRVLIKSCAKKRGHTGNNASVPSRVSRAAPSAEELP